ncbi:MAG: TolC family protein [Peptococcaceae bacterium]|nr:TolC family protein [Peptococcaceae bacterium]
MRRVLTVSLLTILFVLGVTLRAFADEDTQGGSQEQAMQLTLEKAIQRALWQSNALEKADLEVEDADDARTTVSAVYYTNYVPGGEGLIYAAETTQFAYEQAKKQYDLTRDQVILNTYQKYYDVLSAQEQVYSAEASLAQAEKDLVVAEASYQVGLISKVALEGARTKVQSAKAALAEAQGALDDAYAALNQHIGLDEDERPVLVDMPEFEPVTRDVSTYISYVLDESPTLWTAEEAAKYMNRVANYTVNGETPITDEDAEKAELDAEDARDATRLLVRTLYNSVKSLEEARAAAEQGVKVAEETLRITELKAEVGMATAKDVAKARADLAAARQRLFELTCSHTYMKKVLEMPWAYGGGSPGTGGAM